MNGRGFARIWTIAGKDGNMKCLDSDLIIAHLQGNQTATEAIKKLELKDILVTTSINIFEILFGVFNSKYPEDRENADKSLSSLDVLEFGRKEAEFAGKVYADMMKKGKPISLKDLFIGSTALSAHSEMVTRNVRDFQRIPGLKVIEW